MLDLLAGRYPPFLFGFGVGALLPAFHFHETTADALEPAFLYLAENDYHTVTSADVAAFVRHRRPLPDRSVMLAFDDALASLWLVVAPLLRRYGLSAVTYAIPGRIAEAASLRPTLDDGPVDAGAADRSANPFVTWPELRALSSSGLVDVQSHTWSHSMMFSGDRPTGVVTPSTAGEHPLNLPRLNLTDPPRFLESNRLGYPLFDRRSRMSDARRFVPHADDCARLEQFVAAHGGPAFFDRSDWRKLAEPKLAEVRGSWETAQERRLAITHELVAARERLESELRLPVRHVCLPWGVTGQDTRRLLEDLGFETAIANKLTGAYAIRMGDDPFFLKRLPHRHIYALPGRGRRAFRTLR